MGVLSQAISVFSLVLGILLTSCRPGPPSTVTPENLSFRSYRLADARPAGFGYSVISDCTPLPPNMSFMPPTKPAIMAFRAVRTCWLS